MDSDSHYLKHFMWMLVTYIPFERNQQLQISKKVAQIFRLLDSNDG